ncbi:ABC transporter [Pseudodesulfovibrio mercurii]|uniref:ABC transporter n=1 Tax=Pseudodesulfovibrio mercurii TaxID=641491 RepID=F0JE96_9BACT|nr:restriction system-associated AAA family ATPase [Pseudodesulfovibrio mercurii]EGB14705.1 ABC transporter [Pseudodesulfovibrio mercurii]
MKLLYIKITDPKGFRSLQTGFEYRFRSEWDLEEEQGFAPFVCAGPNGSGKSNLLEVLAAIFYHMECIYLANKPDSFVYDEEANPNGFQGSVSTPDAFELTYRFNLIDKNYYTPASAGVAQAGRTLAGVTEFRDRIRPVEIHISKELGKHPVVTQTDLKTGEQEELIDGQKIRKILPEFVLGYSSGENEILSLPFFKMRFVQFDEYWDALQNQLDYPGRPESRLAYLDSNFSQAILLCNLLYHDRETLKPFREDVGIEEIIKFRIIIRLSIEVSLDQALGFSRGENPRPRKMQEVGLNHPAIEITETGDESRSTYRANLIELLEGEEESDKLISRLKRCATCSYEDEATDSLYLDYYVTEETKQAFSNNFDFEVNKSPIALFQAFQVLLMLNLFSVSDTLKSDLYQSDSLYVSETVPTLASDERIVRFKDFWLKKEGVEEPVLLKSLSDGEHQLLHSLGLCLLFKNTQSLFLLDEPETHFNPNWRSSFISRLHDCFKGAGDNHEMLITTHTPFLISDSSPDKVLVFNKTNGIVSVIRPDYNTLGSSINKITMATFDKRETIGGHAQSQLDALRRRFEEGEDKDQVIAEINRQLGDSVEKVLLIKTILDSMEGQS